MVYNRATGHIRIEECKTDPEWGGGQYWSGSSGILKFLEATKTAFNVGPTG